MAGPSVTTTIRLEGEDRASKKINDVANALGRAGASAADAARRTEHVAEKAGDLERGFRGIKDILGNLGASELQGITDKFGGIEAILLGFGPKLGAVGLAIATIGAGAAYWYEQTEKTRKAAYDTQIAVIQASKGDAEAQAKRLGVSAELLGHKDQERTVEAAIGAAKEHAQRLDDTRVKLMEALRDKQTEKTAGLQAEIGSLSLALIKDSARLDVAKQLAAAQRQRDADQILANTREVVEQARIAGILDQKARLNAQAADIAAKTYTITADQMRVQAELKRGVLDEKDLRQQQFDNAKALAELEAKTRANAAEGGARMEAIRAKAAAAAERAAAKRKADLAEQQKQADALAAAWDEAAQAEVAAFQRREDAATKAANAQQAAFDAYRVSQQAATDDPKEKARLRMIELEIAESRKLEQIRADSDLNEQAREAATFATWNEYNAQRRVIMNETAQNDAAVANERVAMAKNIADAVVAMAEREGLAARDAAKLKAAIAAAEGFWLIAQNDYKGAIAAGLAAVAYSQVAFGTSGGRTGTGLAASTDSAGMATATAGPSRGGGGGGGQNIVINYNKGFYGSAQENAKGISRALGSLKSTGMSQWKGA